MIVMRFLTFFGHFEGMKILKKLVDMRGGGRENRAIFARSSDMQKLSLESCQACMNYY